MLLDQAPCTQALWTPGCRATKHHSDTRMYRLDLRVRAKAKEAFESWNKWLTGTYSWVSIKIHIKRERSTFPRSSGFPLLATGDRILLCRHRAWQTVDKSKLAIGLSLRARPRWGAIAQNAHLFWTASLYKFCGCAIFSYFRFTIYWYSAFNSSCIVVESLHCTTMCQTTVFRLFKLDFPWQQLAQYCACTTVLKLCIYI